MGNGLTGFKPSGRQYIEECEEAQDVFEDLLQ